ncbi:MAG: lysostaphin resistance A-like protein [Prevotella sp.]
MKKVLLYFLLFIVIQNAIMVSVTLLMGMSADSDVSMGGKMIAGSVASNAVILACFLVRRWMPFDMMRVSRGNAMRILSPWHFVLGLSALIPSLWVEGLIPESLKEDVLADVLPVMLSSPWGYVAVGLLAPLAEEVVFRGAILCAAYSVFSKNVGERPEARWTAIVMTALLFAGVHFNPAQMPHAMLMGILLGWLTMRTRSIIPAIIIHWLNNSFAFIAYQLWPESYDMSVSEALGPWLAPALIASVAVMTLSVWRVRHMTR